MTTLKRSLMLGAFGLALSAAAGANAEGKNMNYVQVADIQIEPAHLKDYKVAIREQIETAIRVEPGVLALYAVSDKENPTHIRVFEIYRDIEAYHSHLQTAHFKKYKLTTEKMVGSLNLNIVDPIVLGAQ